MFHAPAKLPPGSEEAAGIKDVDVMYNSLWNNIPIGVFRCTLAPLPRFIFVNPFAVRMYGYEGFVEMQGVPVSDVFAEPVDLAVLFLEMQAKGKLQDFVCRQQKRDGSIFWAAISAARVDGEAGVSCCDGVIMDVTDRKRLEDIIERGKKEWETIFDTLTELTFATDLECRVIRCNRTAAVRLGKSFQQVIGQPIHSLFFVDALSDVDPFAAGCREVHIPSLSAHFLITSNYLRDFAVIRGMVHVMIDISDRKKAEEMLAERDLIYRTLAERSHAGVYVVQDGKFRYVNANTASYAGYNREELIGRESNMLVHPDDRKKEEQQAGDMLKGKRTAPYEFRIVTKNGETRWIMETVTSITYEGRQAILGNCMDITERRQREIQDLHVQKLESVGQLAAGIAHEINTPIQFVGDNIHFMSDAFRDIFSLASLYADLKNLNIADPADCADLRGRVLDKMDAMDIGYLREEIPRAIEQSLDGIERVSRIVQAMREFSHPGGVEKTNFDLNRAITATVILSRNEWKYSMELTTSLAPDLPLVEGYPSELHQAILNLIVNAAHAVQARLQSEPGAKGLIEVTTRRAGDEVEVCIRDTGTGIPTEVHAKIFDPFFTTKEVGKGTGQGLTIAQNIIVRKHGGTIYFESKVGEGTAFYIRLPLK